MSLRLHFDNALSTWLIPTIGFENFPRAPSRPLSRSSHRVREPIRMRLYSILLERSGGQQGRGPFVRGVAPILNQAAWMSMRNDLGKLIAGITGIARPVSAGFI